MNRAKGRTPHPEICQGILNRTSTEISQAPLARLSASWLCVPQNSSYLSHLVSADDIRLAVGDLLDLALAEITLRHYDWLVTLG
jgi:hypothetical protein